MTGIPVDMVLEIYMINIGNMSRPIYVLFLMITCVSCSGKLGPHRSLIRLTADVSSVNIETRSPFEGAPSDQNTLEMTTYFSYEKGVFTDPVSPVEPYIPCRTSVVFDSSDPKDVKYGDHPLEYPTSGTLANNNVYCVGLYPNENWTVTTDNQSKTTSFSHVIDGDADVMWGEQIAGSHQNNFPPMKVEHLLTWVKINISATSAKAAEVWGDVKDLTIYTPNDVVRINVSSSAKTTIEYTGTETPLKCISSTDPVTQPEKLTVVAHQVGSKICSPPEALDGQFGYRIVIKATGVTTEKEIFVPILNKNGVPISEQSEAVGALVPINLYFNEIAVVNGVCTLSYWEDVDEDLELNEVVNSGN